MRIDLHTHSWVSDGTESPAELVRQAAAAGIDVISVTDHDTADGWPEARRTAEQEGMGWVGGMEITARVPSSGVSVHMLAYLVDPQDPALSGTLAELKRSRDVRARRMVELLEEDYPLTWDAVVAQTQPGTTIGRPHVADALVAAGIVHDRTQAFGDMLSPRSRYYVGHEALAPVEAVRLIHAAGGVAVMAHPAAGKRGRVISEQDMLEVVEAGLDGVEIEHRDNGEEGRAFLRRLAREHDLIVTGSSDYHGAGKPNALGENLTEPSQLLRILETATTGSRFYSGIDPAALARA